MQEKINQIWVNAHNIGISVSKNERTRLREIERDNNPTDEDKTYLSDLLVALNKIQRHQSSDYHDVLYSGLRDTKFLYGVDDNYYRAMLTKQAFDDGYEEYEINGDKHMNLSLEQYIDQITPELLDLLQL